MTLLTPLAKIQPRHNPYLFNSEGKAMAFGMILGVQDTFKDTFLQNDFDLKTLTLGTLLKAVRGERPTVYMDDKGQEQTVLDATIRPSFTKNCMAKYCTINGVGRPLLNTEDTHLAKRLLAFLQVDLAPLRFWLRLSSGIG